MSKQSSQSIKSKMFATTFILTFVFGFAFLLTARSCIDMRGETRDREQFRTAAHALPGGSFTVDENSGALNVSSGNYNFKLTINPKLQATAEQLFKQYDPVSAAFVMMDSETGEILTMAAYSRKRKDLPFYATYRSCLDPELRTGSHPMASIAKLITSAAAVELKIAGPGDRFKCSGKYRVKDQGTVHDPRGVSHGKISMGHALSTSCNPVFAQIGLKVGRKNLEKYYDKFMFNRAIDFDLPVTESGAAPGRTEFGLAMAGAGYEGSWMSPIHAAMIAASIQNGGVMMRPYMVTSLTNKGKQIYSARQEKFADTVKPKTAKTLANMMSGTVNAPHGTAYRGFYKKNRKLIPGMDFTGKTGSINGNTPSEFYTWFIGNTEKSGRKLAFAAMVVNDTNWRIKAASFSGQFFQVAAEDIE